MSDVNLTISQEVVRPIVEAKIQAAIIAELEKSADVIESMVAKALTDSCDERGEKGKYDNKYTFIERCCYHAVQEASKLALKEYLLASRPKLIAAMKKAVEKRTEDIACGFVDAMIEQSKSAYSFTVDLKVAEKKTRY